MPELVSQVEHPPPVVPGQGLAVLIQVGHVGQLGIQPPLVLGSDIAAPGDLQRAEALGEGDLLLVGQRLPGEGQHGEAVHPGLDLPDVLRA